MKGEYKAGEKEGDFIFYYPNGQLEMSGRFEHNYRKGTWNFFYPDGKPKLRIEFDPLYIEQPRIIFFNDSTGVELIKRGTGKWFENIQYSNGVSATITGSYRNYKRHGLWTFKTSNEDYVRQEEYTAGVFKRAALINSKGRLEVDIALPYSLSYPDKFYYTERFYARQGITFKTYPRLKTMTVNESLMLNTPTTDIDDVLVIVEQSPAPSEGMTGFYKFIADNITYPAEARIKKQQGKVFVQFVIEKDGSLTSFKVIKGIGQECDDEAIRVLQEYAKDHKWNPGMQRGKPVRTQLVLPITFGFG
jgi:TonB family protein